MVSLSESSENYLKSILILKKTNGAVRSVDLARYMGFSKASISIAVNKLCGEGYVVIDGDGVLELTAVGRAAAEAVYERHCFFEEKLTEWGVPQERAHVDACRLEHAVSKESFEAIRKSMAEPQWKRARRGPPVKRQVLTYKACGFARYAVESAGNAKEKWRTVYGWAV